MTHRKTWRVHTINTETSVDFSLDLVKEEAVDEHIDAGWMDGWNVLRVFVRMSNAFFRVKEAPTKYQEQFDIAHTKSN